MQNQIFRAHHLLALVFLAALPACAQQAQEAGCTETVQIVTVPHAGGGPAVTDTIAGCVKIDAAETYKIVLYAHTDKWYVQPYVAAPLTDIGENGLWRARIHLGEEYAALLVKLPYDPPATTYGLPNIGGAVIAIAREPARGR